MATLNKSYTRPGLIRGKTADGIPLRIEQRWVCIEEIPDKERMLCHGSSVRDVKRQLARLFK